VQWQQALYDELIQQTGLKGNRAEPLTRQNLHEVRETVMPAVLLELGFMDSSVDVPIILTDQYAEQCAAAIVSVIAKKAKLPQKSQSDPLYRVQVGAFKQRKNAEALLKKLQDAGYSDAFIR
jgi:N-acetylmuramoyl-L-alanine amidase